MTHCGNLASGLIQLAIVCHGIGLGFNLKVGDDARTEGMTGDYTPLHIVLMAAMTRDLELDVCAASAANTPRRSLALTPPLPRRLGRACTPVAPAEGRITVKKIPAASRAEPPYGPARTSYGDFTGNEVRFKDEMTDSGIAGGSVVMACGTGPIRPLDMSTMGEKGSVTTYNILNDFVTTDFDTIDIMINVPYVMTSRGDIRSHTKMINMEMTMGDQPRMRTGIEEQISIAHAARLGEINGDPSRYMGHRNGRCEHQGGESRGSQGLASTRSRRLGPNLNVQGGA